MRWELSLRSEDEEEEENEDEHVACRSEIVLGRRRRVGATIRWNYPTVSGEYIADKPALQRRFGSTLKGREITAQGGAKRRPGYTSPGFRVRPGGARESNASESAEGFTSLRAGGHGGLGLFLAFHRNFGRTGRSRRRMAESVSSLGRAPFIQVETELREADF